MTTDTSQIKDPGASRWENMLSAFQIKERPALGQEIPNTDVLTERGTHPGPRHTGHASLLPSGFHSNHSARNKATQNLMKLIFILHFASLLISNV